MSTTGGKSGEGPWSQFAVGQPSQNQPWANDRLTLSQVAHVAHLRAGLRIVEDRRFRADLVFDESVLNTERIRVVWLSPNDWSNAGGFRYGNVRFSFHWGSIVEGKRYFWVESIAYGIPACRILVTQNDYSGLLTPYNPTQDRGPWWIAPSGEHFWNGKYCLEIMVEEDLLLDQVIELDFVRHHPRFCSIGHQTCAYKGTDDDEAAGKFLGALVAAGHPISLPGLIQQQGEVLKPGRPLRQAYIYLYFRCLKLTPPAWGNLDSTNPYAPAVARSLLRALVSDGLGADIDYLASFFRNSEQLTRSIGDLFARSAGLQGAEVFH